MKQRLGLACFLSLIVAVVAMAQKGQPVATPQNIPMYYKTPSDGSTKRVILEDGPNTLIVCWQSKQPDEQYCRIEVIDPTTGLTWMGNKK
jgi:hypothetical protein